VRDLGQGLVSKIDVATPMVNIEIAPALIALTRWHRAVASRPSASA
jgi:hypothetical protein